MGTLNLPEEGHHHVVFLKADEEIPFQRYLLNDGEIKILFIYLN